MLHSFVRRQNIMDVATGVGAFQKVLDMIRALPFWLLLAVSIISVGLWCSPTLSMPLPPELKRWVPLAAFSFSILTLASALIWVASSRQAKRTREHARDAERFTKIYRPLYALFLTHHIAIHRVMGCPKLSQRIARAWSEFRHYRYWKARFRHGLAALSDRKISYSAEVEFGGSFPLAEINRVVNENLSIADSELLELLRRANRSTYEYDGNADALTGEERELFTHVVGQHEFLRKRTGL
ncbi:hypothetical protein ACUSIJ_14480 [Pseudochelatococcus sp. B33]